jgi:MazG family protein
MTIEEAYEVAEAIESGEDRELQAELGDLLLQVVFHTQIASEEQRFTLADVLATLTAKLVRRHPHVFGDDDGAATPEQVLRNWEAVKTAEREAQGKQGSEESMLESVSKRLPAVMEAFQMTTKVARVGFDWPDARAAFGKVEEEMEELEEALATTLADRRAIEHELGDLLFALVNVARLLGLDPESALKGSNRRFRRRFHHIERRLAAQGRTPAESNLGEMDALWDEAKALEVGAAQRVSPKADDHVSE